MQKTKMLLQVFMMTLAIGTLAVFPFSNNAGAISSSSLTLQDDGKVKKVAKERLQSLYKKLEMNRDQYDEAWTVVYEYVGDFMELKQEATVFDKWKDIRNNFKERMKGILDEEQYKKFAEGKWETNDREELKAAME
ncbi:MAG: hypothetical protein BRD50_00755 [Bacteroidetes bacterium SW_11_45_7]|nr:MAG: hypothetical protein BRD50_00755 [Bacteroidetes bacterium SW_11_45_7]